MKLSPEQKYRIQVFHALNPDVSHQDLADLFEVARATVSGCLHRDQVPTYLQAMNKHERRRWIMGQIRAEAEVELFDKELPF